MKIDAQFKGPETAADVKVGQVVIAHTQRTQECFAMRLIDSRSPPASPLPFAVVGCRVGPDEPGYFSDGHVLFLNADYPVTVFDVVSPLQLVERTKATRADEKEPLRAARRPMPVGLCPCERCVGIRMSIKAAGVDLSGTTHATSHRPDCGCMVCEVNRINAIYNGKRQAAEVTVAIDAATAAADTAYPPPKPDAEPPADRMRCKCVVCRALRLMENGNPF